MLWNVRLLVGKYGTINIDTQNSPTKYPKGQGDAYTIEYISVGWGSDRTAIAVAWLDQGKTASIDLGTTYRAWPGKSEEKSVSDFIGWRILRRGLANRNGIVYIIEGRRKYNKIIEICYIHTTPGCVVEMWPTTCPMQAVGCLPCVLP